MIVKCCPYCKGEKVFRRLVSREQKEEEYPCPVCGGVGEIYIQGAKKKKDKMREKEDTVVTSIRLPKQLKRHAKVVAAERDTTLNKIVVRLLKNYIAEEELEDKVLVNSGALSEMLDAAKKEPASFDWQEELRKIWEEVD